MRVINLTQGLTALVDDDDFDRVNDRLWHAYNPYGDGYTARGRNESGELELLHRVIMRAEKGEHIKSKDNFMNGDFSKSNLYRANGAQFYGEPRTRELPTLEGVYLDISHSQYAPIVYGRGGRIRRDLGFYETEEEAHAVYLQHTQ